jgi:hypothetical protein
MKRGTVRDLIALQNLGTQLPLPLDDFPTADKIVVPDWMRVYARLTESRKSRAVLRVIKDIKASRHLPYAVGLADGEFWTGIPNEILEAQRRHHLSGAEHAVLVFLYSKCWYKKPGGDALWPAISLDGFAAATGLDRRTVQRALNVLEGLQIIGVLHRGRGRGVRNLYAVRPATDWLEKAQSNRGEIAPISVLHGNLAQ